jgi:Protein of unknown function (DUF2934)
MVAENMAMNLPGVAKERPSMKAPTEEQIRKRAYEIYLRHRKPGRDVIDWLQAELELKQMAGRDEDEPTTVGSGRNEEFKKGF